MRPSSGRCRKIPMLVVVVAMVIVCEMESVTARVVRRVRTTRTLDDNNDDDDDNPLQASRLRTVNRRRVLQSKKSRTESPAPTFSSQPSAIPSQRPSSMPSMPTGTPSDQPSMIPTRTPVPSQSPSLSPAPTTSPSDMPSMVPTITAHPTIEAVIDTNVPTAVASPVTEQPTVTMHTSLRLANITVVVDQPIAQVPRFIAIVEDYLYAAFRRVDDGVPFSTLTAVSLQLLQISSYPTQRRSRTTNVNTNTTGDSNNNTTTITDIVTALAYEFGGVAHFDGSDPPITPEQLHQFQRDVLHPNTTRFVADMERDGNVKIHQVIVTAIQTTPGGNGGGANTTPRGKSSSTSTVTVWASVGAVLIVLAIVGIVMVVLVVRNRRIPTLQSSQSIPPIDYQDHPTTTPRNNGKDDDDDDDDDEQGGRGSHSRALFTTGSALMSPRDDGIDRIPDDESLPPPPPPVDEEHHQPLPSWQTDPLILVRSNVDDDAISFASSFHPPSIHRNRPGGGEGENDDDTQFTYGQIGGDLSVLDGDYSLLMSINQKVEAPFDYPRDPNDSICSMDELDRLIYGSAACTPLLVAGRTPTANDISHRQQQQQHSVIQGEDLQLAINRSYLNPYLSSPEPIPISTPMATGSTLDSDRASSPPLSIRMAIPAMSLVESSMEEYTTNDGDDEEDNNDKEMWEPMYQIDEPSQPSDEDDNEQDSQPSDEDEPVGVPPRQKLKYALDSSLAESVVGEGGGMTPVVVNKSRRSSPVMENPTGLILQTPIIAASARKQQKSRFGILRTGETVPITPEEN